MGSDPDSKASNAEPSDVDGTDASAAAAREAAAAPFRVQRGSAPTLLGRLDHMMTEHPWYPRVMPFIAYILLLTIIGFIAERVPQTYAFLYPLQCIIVVAMLWRYRKLIPELTIRFHWLAIPVGVFVFIAWVWVGMVIDEWSQMKHMGLFEFTRHLWNWSFSPAATQGVTTATGEAFSFVDYASRSQSVFIRMGLAEGNALAWTAFILRLLGMSLVVPLFEELFIRSAILRSMNDRRNTMLGFAQVLSDFPLIGERIMDSRLGQEAEKHPPMFEREFHRVPLGQLTIFGVFMSTLIFTISHAPRDYAGCIICGIAYCLLLRATRHKGLGPVCWAHGITNALLWCYTLHTNDWRFL
ncbi:MAG: hypothetical protein WD768_05980 [Phycisphaeraceae bacterium]